MSTRQVSGAGDRRADRRPRACRIEKLVAVGPAAAAQVEDRLARAVARQLGLGAVGVEDPQVGHVRGVRRRREQQHAVGERRRSAPSHSRRTRAGGELERELVALDDQVVVAEGLPLLEAHGHAASESRISRAIGRRIAPGDVDHAHARELAHPRQLALGVVARAALHPLDVAREQLLEAERLARRLRGAGGVRARSTSSRAPAASISSTRRVDRARRAPRAPSSARRAASGGAAPRSTAARGPRAARARPSSSSSSARTTRWRSLGSIPSAAHGARSASTRVQRRRRPALELGRPALAHALRRRRAQVELGQRRAQVQAGAADDDRPPPCGEQLVDLRVRELGVLPDAEGRVERQERHEPVLERRLLGRARRRP